MNNHRNTFLLAALAGGLVLMPFSARAAETPHEESHAHDVAGIAQLQSDDGRKWPTDASLRAGMASIRSAFEADHAAIHAGSETPAQFETLAGSVEAQVQMIIRQCQLPPAADANLHFLIADLMRGVSRMRGQDPAHTRHDGAALVHGALEAYGKYFDDPQWSRDAP